MRQMHKANIQISSCRYILRYSGKSIHSTEVRRPRLHLLHLHYNRKGNVRCRNDFRNDPCMEYSGGSSGGGSGRKSRNVSEGDGKGRDSCSCCHNWVLPTILLCNYFLDAFNIDAQAHMTQNKPERGVESTLSIVIPVLNESRCIRKTLLFAKELLPSALEIIVVDGGSTDGTQQIVKEMKGITLFETNLMTRSKQMNKGALEAKGDLITFLHADTIPPLDLVTLQQEKFADQRVCLTGFPIIIEHRSRTYWGYCALGIFKTYVCPFAFTPFSVMRGCRLVFGDQIMTCRRKDFLAVGGFSESMNILEDMDLCFKLFYGQKQRDPRFTTVKYHYRPIGRKIAIINRCIHTSGRRMHLLGVWNCFRIYAIFYLSYTFKASVANLNELAQTLYGQSR